MVTKGNRIYLDNLLYMVPNDCGEYNVYDDGEYEGRYCGSLEFLEELEQEKGQDAMVRYVLAGL